MLAPVHSAVNKPADPKGGDIPLLGSFLETGKLSRREKLGPCSRPGWLAKAAFSGAALLAAGAAPKADSSKPANPGEALGPEPCPSADLQTSSMLDCML